MSRLPDHGLRDFPTCHRYLNLLVKMPVRLDSRTGIRNSACNKNVTCLRCAARFIHGHDALVEVAEGIFGSGATQPWLKSASVATNFRACLLSLHDNWDTRFEKEGTHVVLTKLIN